MPTSGTVFYQQGRFFCNCFLRILAKRAVWRGEKEANFGGFRPRIHYICRDMKKNLEINCSTGRCWHGLLLLCLALLCQSCAMRRAPSGGPEDKTPPRVVRTFPRPDSTNVRSLPYIEIEFNENVDRNSLREQVGMMPEPPGGFEIKWKGGKILRVVLKDSLDPNQTYIVNVGTELRDYRGNRLKAPVVITFSTGENIDRGQISGQILAKAPEEVFIYAYPLEGGFDDGMIFAEKPRYYTQGTAAGTFQIGYLRPGAYRVYALEDNNRDRLYTLQTDQIGLPFDDVRLDSAHLHFENCNFTLIREDTTAPKIARAAAIHHRLVEVGFTESLQLAQRPGVTIVDSLSGTELPVLAALVDPQGPTRLLVYTAPQRQGTYLGKVTAVVDSLGNRTGDMPLEFRFTGKIREDTAQVKLRSISPAPGGKNVPYDAAIELQFSHPVDSTTLPPAFQLLGPDSQNVAGQWWVDSPLNPRFVPDTLLQKGQTYTLRLDLPAVRSIFEKPFADSVFVSQFTTYDFANLGEISGTVRVDQSRRVGPETPQAILQVTAVRGTAQATVTAPINQKYIIPFLPDGPYRIRAILDLNRNGEYDKGRSLPFEFAEPFLLRSDTVRVRKRWTTEGIDFDF